MLPNDQEDVLEWIPDATWRRRFRLALRRWYDRHARDLPWRATADPYAIWVSETMLQQTQVETVKGYYARFLQQFPTVRDLAAAPEHEVLRLWEGLGYYRRARQLHQAARQIVAQHEGQFPQQIDAVRALPGIGRYTAGAVLSIACDQRQPILEANTIRLFCRLLGFDGDPWRAAGQRLLWTFAEAILPTREVGRFNQALMELGSCVCFPQQPDCNSCPVAALCPTRAQGRQAEIPAAKEKTRYEAVHESAVVIWRGKRLLLRPCATGERWAGLWDFPRFVPQQFPPAAREIATHIERQLGIDIEMRAEQTEMKYGVTRYRIQLAAFAANYRRGRLRPEHRYEWVDVAALRDYPLSVTGRKLFDWSVAQGTDNG